MTDTIELRGLQVAAFCGLLPEERERRQPFEIDLDIELDIRGAATTDDLDRTVDYGAVCADVAGLAETGRYDLLERFSTEIAELVLGYPPVTAVTVVVRKLRPPVPQLLATSGVRIRRTRADVGRADA